MHESPESPTPEVETSAETETTPEAETSAEVETTPEAETSAESPEAGADSQVEQVREALRAVIDPELGISVVDLGLVYDIEVEGSAATVTMTLTSPGCPAGGQILGGAKAAAESVDGVEVAEISLVWKPFWTADRIDPKIRAAMGF